MVKRNLTQSDVYLAKSIRSIITRVRNEIYTDAENLSIVASLHAAAGAINDEQLRIGVLRYLSSSI